MIRAVVYPEAEVVFDTSKPDGTPRKRLDVTRLHELGWRHRIPLREGIATTYDWFTEHYEHTRGVSRAHSRVGPYGRIDALAGPC